MNQPNNEKTTDFIKHEKEDMSTKEWLKEAILPNHVEAHEFLIKEVNSANLRAWFSSIILIIPIIVSIVFMVLKINHHGHWYYFLLPVVVVIVFSFVLFKHWVYYFALRKDIKISNKKPSIHPPISIARKYKELHTSLININWFSIGVYIYGGLAILFIHILGGVSTKSGGIHIIKWEKVKFSYFMILGIMFITFIYHIFQFIYIRTKIAKILTAFGNNIISDGELTIIKKMTRSRDIKIAFIVFIITFLPFAIFFKKVFGK